MLTGVAACGGSGDARTAEPALRPVSDHDSAPDTGEGPGPGTAAESWTVQPVYPGYDPRYIAIDLNNAGHVLGTQAILPRTGPSYKHRDIALVVAPRSEGDPSTILSLDYYQQTFGFALNDKGQVLGRGMHYVPDEEGYPRGAPESFLYSDGQYHVVPEGSAWVNKLGQVAGTSTTITTEDGVTFLHERAFLFSGGVNTDIPLLPQWPSHSAAAINDAGQVAGNAFHEARIPEMAFLYSEGSMQEIGLCTGAQGSVASALNNAGQVTGYCYDSVDEEGQPRGTRPFIYHEGSLQMLPAPSELTIPSDINDHGHVGGSYFLHNTPHPDGMRGYVYRDGQFINLSNSPGIRDAGWTITSIARINNAGQMLGRGRQAGQSHDTDIVLSPVR